jgi:hypothetical protein
VNVSRRYKQVVVRRSNVNRSALESFSISWTDCGQRTGSGENVGQKALPIDAVPDVKHDKYRSGQISRQSGSHKL